MVSWNRIIEIVELDPTNVMDPEQNKQTDIATLNKPYGSRSTVYIVAKNNNVDKQNNLLNYYKDYFEKDVGQSYEENRPE